MPADRSTHDKRRYRKIFTRLWRNPEFADLLDGEKLLALYVLSGPQANRIGLFRFSIGEAAEDLGLTVKVVTARLTAICKAFGWVFDTQSRVLWIPTWWVWNDPKENLKAFQGALTDLNDVPKTPLIARFCHNLAGIPASMTGLMAGLRGDSMPDRIGDRIPDQIGARSQEQEKEQEKEQEQEQEQETFGRRLLDLWNATVQVLPKVQAFTRDRLRKATARWKEKPSEPVWVGVFGRMDASDFLTGRKPGKDHPDWRADIDFALKPGVADKVLEGKYDNARGAVPVLVKPDARGHMPPCRSNTECNRLLEQEIEARRASQAS